MHHEKREEVLQMVAVVPRNVAVTFVSGKREFVFKPKDLEHYFGERARRGNSLPRGLSRIDRINCDA